MKVIRLSAVAFLLLAAATPSFAALSKDYAAFLKGPADFLLTKEERKQWKSITTDEKAKAFVDLFWARRDPTPTTAKNEFRQDFDERVKNADARFHSSYGTGSDSDRAKVFILMGSPTRIRRSNSMPVSTIQVPAGRPTGRPADMGGGGNGVQGYSPKELWEYEQGKTPVQLGQPLVQIAFVDQYGTGDWKLEHTPQTDTASLFESIAKSYIAQPDLRSVPVFTEAEAAPAAPAAVAPAAPTLTSLKTDAFRAAVEESRAAKAPSDRIFATYGEFVTPKGEHFVPVQLYLPKSAGISADGAVTFFGSVERDGGETAAVFEEEAALQPTTDGVFFARTLNLLPGTYRASLGLARDGKPIGVTTIPMVLGGLDKDAPGVSALILSNNIYPLTEAQSPTDPFAFGGLKVVPKSDGVFRQKEELSYFFEVRNPGIDPATSQPQLWLKVTISGTTTEGKPVRMAGAPAATPMTELKGVPGHWAVGQAIPLSKFKPGSYTIALKATDGTSKQSYDLTGTFRVVE